MYYNLQRREYNFESTAFVRGKFIRFGFSTYDLFPVGRLGHIYSPLSEDAPSTKGGLFLSAYVNQKIFCSRIGDVIMLIENCYL